MEALHLKELLHNLTQALLYPTMIILLILAIVAVVMIGSIIVEAIVERKHYKAELPSLLAAIDSASYRDLAGIVEGSGLIRKQKDALLTLVAYGYMPEESRIALAKRLLSEQEQGFVKVTSRMDLIAKIAPMIGLMGTLIPLGPGVVAMGQGQIDLLSSSIEIAFDTTITGLLVAAIALFVGRFRKRWYEDYTVALECAMTAVLEKAAASAEQGEFLGNAQSAAEAVSRLGSAGSKSPIAQ